MIGQRIEFCSRRAEPTERNSMENEVESNRKRRQHWMR